MKLFFVVVLCTIAAVANGLKIGVDFPSLSATSGDAVTCITNKGSVHNEDNTNYAYFNVHIANSNGLIQAGLDTLLNARGKTSPIDMLIDICPKKVNNTYDMVKDVLQKVRDGGDNNPLDTIQYVFMSALQNPGDEDCWYTNGSADDKKKNIAALNSGMEAIRASEKFLGVKTNKQNWKDLTDDWNGISAGGWQLWWASEGSTTFDDFETFGGWSAPPALRQYQLNATKCGVSVNMDLARDNFFCNGYGQACDCGCCAELACNNGVCGDKPCSSSVFRLFSSQC